MKLLLFITQTRYKTMTKKTKKNTYRKKTKTKNVTELRAAKWIYHHSFSFAGDLFPDTDSVETIFTRMLAWRRLVLRQETVIFMYIYTSLRSEATEAHTDAACRYTSARSWTLKSSFVYDIRVRFQGRDGIIYMRWIGDL